MIKADENPITMAAHGSTYPAAGVIAIIPMIDPDIPTLQKGVDLKEINKLNLRK